MMATHNGNSASGQTIGDIVRGHTARRSYCKPLACTPQCWLDPFSRFPPMMRLPSHARITINPCTRPGDTIGGKVHCGRPAVRQPTHPQR